MLEVGMVVGTDRGGKGRRRGRIEGDGGCECEY